MSLKRYNVLRMQPLSRKRDASDQMRSLSGKPCKVIRMRPLSKKRYNVLRMQPLSRKRDANAQMRPMSRKRCKVARMLPLLRKRYTSDQTEPCRRNRSSVVRMPALSHKFYLRRQNAKYCRMRIENEYRICNHDLFAKFSRNLYWELT